MQRNLLNFYSKSLFCEMTKIDEIGVTSTSCLNVTPLTHSESSIVFEHPPASMINRNVSVMVGEYKRDRKRVRVRFNVRLCVCVCTSAAASMINSDVSVLVGEYNREKVRVRV